MTLAGYNLQDNVYIYSNNKCMCVFLISPVPIAEPLTSELIDTPVFYNLAPRPIKYRVSVPIPMCVCVWLTRELLKDAAEMSSMVRSVKQWCMLIKNTHASVSMLHSLPPNTHADQFRHCWCLESRYQTRKPVRLQKWVSVVNTRISMQRLIS